MALNQGNCGITIIRYRTGFPPALECFNDTGHLWSGVLRDEDAGFDAEELAESS